MDDRLDDEGSRALPQLRIDELLDELQGRLSAVRSSRDRVRQLLEAVVGIGSGPDLDTALTRIVQAAATLVDAEYGALGVLDGEERIARFITVGLSPEQIAQIGPYPQGRGLLGELIRHPEPLRAQDLSKHPQSYGLPANHPPMHSFLGVPIRVGAEVFGNLYMTEKEGGTPFDADDEAVLTALAAAAGVAIDNARLYDESRRRQEQSEAANELTRGLLSGRPVGEVLSDFTRRVRALARADLALVGLPDAEGEDILVAAADGIGAERIRGTALEIEGSLLGAVFKAGRTEMVADVAGDPRSCGDLAPETAMGPAILVPLGGPGQVRGVLSVVRAARGAPFEESVLALVSDLAVQAAVVLELADRRREGELLSRYADRDRVGRDLHDLAIQRLFATSMSLQGAYKITQKPAVAARIAAAITDLDDTIKVIRSTVLALHSHELSADDSPGVRALVIEGCERVSQQLGFNPSVRFIGPVDRPVSEEVADHLPAVLREALSNAARYAQPKVDVEVAADGSKVVLRVVDDGMGISTGGRRSGPVNLAERAEQFDSRFSAVPGADGGTAVVRSVPLDRADAGAD